MSKRIPSKKLAKLQQVAINDLDAMRRQIELLVEGPGGIASFSTWFTRDMQFAEGQLNMMLLTAASMLRQAVETFEDCSESGVRVQP